MKLTHNIESLEEIMAYILSQEGDDYACRNTSDKARSTWSVKEMGILLRRNRSAGSFTRNILAGLVHTSAGTVEIKVIGVMDVGRSSQKRQLVCFSS